MRERERKGEGKKIEETTQQQSLSHSSEVIENKLLPHPPHPPTSVLQWRKGKCCPGKLAPAMTDAYPDPQAGGAVLDWQSALLPQGHQQKWGMKVACHS